ncbi:hypothetical protein ACFWXO_22040 [Kitasatospora sp. NPDC059088]
MDHGGLAAARDNNRSLERRMSEFQAQFLEEQPPAAERHLRPLR